MPSLQHVSFAITRRFHCHMCNSEWSSTINIPQAGFNCREHTTIRVLLQKALHASSSVLYGNITIEDIKEEYTQVLSRKLKECQGVIALECQPREPPEWSCPDCLYKQTEECQSLCQNREHLSRDSGYRLTQILDTSIRSEASGMSSSGVDCPNSRELSTSSLHAPSPLDETRLHGNMISDYSLTNLLHSSKSKESASPPPTTAARPVPAPRTSTRSTISDVPTTTAPTPNRNRNQNASNPSIYSHSSISSTGTVDSELYEHPATYVPSLPPKTGNIFHYRIPRKEIEDALKMRRAPYCFAIVELEIKEGGRGALRTPWLIICPAMEQGYKLILQKRDGRVFIHEKCEFNTLKELLNYYSKNPTGCGAYLKNQLTLHEFTNIRQRRLAV